MFKNNKPQLTIGEHLFYQNLPDDILSRINKLIDARLVKAARKPGKDDDFFCQKGRKDALWLQESYCH